ncbi:type II secretion system F family protein [Butyrivibrio sp. VCB2001]|uniref:type II secretion system F family protein n=1 Tax=Butyrivibrio sp. VCB2001 TaxID=1280667 RepID=UPI00041543A7|nr:type II secretion system F family protein [Butyrivibrio sp. VCB2001]
MSKLAFTYLIFPLAMLILWFFSKDLELPQGIEDTGISRAYLKISLFIFRNIRGRVRSFSSEKIRMYLGTLEQKKDLDSAETEYFIRKISVVLLMASAGCFLAFMMAIGAGQSSKINNGRVIERNSFGEKEYEVDLVATDENGEEIGEYTLPVETRQYTDEEANALFEEASEVLERIVLKENESFDDVTKDLSLPERIPGYPFDIRWKIDNLEVIHFDGELIEEMIPKEGALVNLSAIYSYRDLRWQQSFCARIRPRDLTPVERTFLEIKELLDKADEDSKEKQEIILPESFDEGEIHWSEKVTDNSMLLLMLTLIGSAASYVLKDKELKKAMEERGQQMLGDYPQFVSQIVLYMGAGMTMRNIFEKLGNGYLRKKKEIGEKKYLYEEVLRAGRELSAGASEGSVYEHFGLRCSGQQYTRLSTLLSQNLRKGNSELLALLQEESKKAFDERMDRVRKAGEEAGTRLLLPMIIMLVIVMIVIMIPAYMAF